MADKLNGILFSEILADNAGGNAVDTDGDGNTNKSDEFIELQNATGATVSLDGYELWSDKGGLLFAFGSGDNIPPGDTATVVGNYSGGSVPTGFYDAGVSESTNWLPDGEGQKFETVYLVDTATGEYIQLSYGNPPRPPDPPTGFPGTTLIGDGESVDSNAPNATSILRDANGDFVEGVPTPDTPGVPCFVAGTRILTEDGLVPVESITPGLQILTKDCGYQAVRAVRSVTVASFTQRRSPEVCPVTIPANTFGTHDALTVSPAHRVLLTGAMVELVVGSAEAFASAAQCAGFNGIFQHAPGKPVTYLHLLFNDHQVICANGMWTESLFLGDFAHAALQFGAGWKVDQGVTLSALHHAKTACPILSRFETAAVMRTRCSTKISTLAAA